jgi:hypothetical protein
VGSGFQPAMVGPLHSLRVAAALIDELVEAAHAINSAAHSTEGTGSI